MNYISLSQFLKLFRHSPGTASSGASTESGDVISLRAFIQTARVDASGEIRRLQDYIKQGKLTDDDVQNLYTFIVHEKYDYLTAVYIKSLRVPEDSSIHDSPMELGAFKNNTKLIYKNKIRNLFYREILSDTKTEIKNVRSYLEVILDLFKHHIIDYKLLTPSGLRYIRRGNASSILAGFYFRASIMNPYLVYSLNHRLFQARSVFTPTLGWCSYMTGFLEGDTKQVKRYTGVDVIPAVCRTAKRLAVTDYPFAEVSIYCRPSEDLIHDTHFVKTHRGKYDTIFFSPPYYRLELYPGCDKKQSTDRYETYQDWLDGYWKQTIALCHVVAKPGAILCYIVSGYVNYPDMVSDMNRITSFYFKPQMEFPMMNSTLKNSKNEDPSEMIYVFQKKKQIKQ